MSCQALADCFSGAREMDVVRGRGTENAIMSGVRAASGGAFRLLKLVVQQRICWGAPNGCAGAAVQSAVGGMLRWRCLFGSRVSWTGLSENVSAGFAMWFSHGLRSLCSCAWPLATHRAHTAPTQTPPATHALMLFRPILRSAQTLTRCRTSRACSGPRT